MRGGLGYGATLPRYFTQLVVSPVSRPEVQLFVINNHFDLESIRSRQAAVRMMREAIEEYSSQLQGKSLNVLVSGDFNTDDYDPIFREFTYNNKKIPSVRRILPDDKTDLKGTFNGCHRETKSNNVVDHIWVLSEDYQP